MRRTDGILLAYLVVRRRPAAKQAVREVLSRLPRDEASAGSVAQGLIRAKLLAPQEYVLLQARLEAARRTCARCGRAFVCVPGPTARARRCPCGHRNVVAAAETGARTRADGSQTALVAAGSDDAHATTTAARLPRRIGRYQVLDRVGDGGMGIIFKVLDPGSRRVVALKLLRGDASRDAQERFQRETQAIARLRHPAIIKVHDVGQDERGRHFFTMDFVEGQELGQARRALDRARFLEVVATVAEGLHHAHEQGIIHRDIKPQNIIIEPSGAPRIADFGLARDLGRSSLTEEGDLVGTPLYMSPEQLRGDPDAIDRRTDVYALGVLLYEGLTDALPITAKSFPELQARMASEAPERPSARRPDIPRALERIVLRALEKAPDDRYPTALALAEDLRAFLRGDLVAVPGPPLASSALRAGKRLARRLRTPAGVAGLAVLAVGVTGAAALLHAHQRTQAHARAHAELEERKARCARALAAAQAALAQGRARLAEGRLDEALREAQTATRLAAEAAEEAGGLGAQAPRDAAAQAAAAREEAQALEAQALARGDPAARDRARALYAGLLERRPRDAELRLALGQLELRDGHVRPAFDHLARARALAPDRRDVRFWLAEAHMAAGRPKFAEEEYEAALAPPRAAGVSAAWALAGLARARTALGALARARADVDAALREDPRDARVRVAAAGLLLAEGREPEALAALDEASRALPREPLARLHCGLAWARAGDRARALEELDAAVELDPTARALAARARLRALVGDAAGAGEDLARALARAGGDDPDRRVALLVAARHHRGLGRPGEAVAAASQALEQPGLEAAAADLVPLLLERAAARVQAGGGDDLLAAGRDLERAAELAPGAASVERARAHLAMRRRDPQVALAVVNRLLEAAPGDAEALVLRARALLALEDPRAIVAVAEAATAQARLARGEPRLVDLVGGATDEALVLLAQGRHALDRARQAEAGGLGRRALLARARLFVERAARLAPWLAPARVALGRALFLSGQPEPALAELERAVETGGTDEAHGLQGELLAALDRHADAALALGRALELVEALGDSPARRRREAALRLARARSLTTLGREREAVADLDRAVELAPKDVEAYELRAGLLRRLDGTGARAAVDEARVQLLRRDYVDVCDRAREAAWEARARGDHLGAERHLEAAFAVCSAAVDPVRLADLHLLRAFMRVRAFALPEALVDLAAMIELTPRGFGYLYDEVAAYRPEQGFDLAAILERVRQLAPEQVDVDPDFLAGFVAFVALEFAQEPPPEQATRDGLRALDRYLDRAPAHPGALLLRAVLLMSLREPAQAARGVAAAFEAQPPPAYAHYVRARLRARGRDLDGALEALGAALDGGFTVYRSIELQRDLDDVRQDPRYQRLVELSHAAGYLADLERGERIIGREAARGRDPRELWRECAATATAGVKALRRHLEVDDPAAGLAAARLYLARGRQAHRLGDARGAARDLAAALECTPRVVLDWQQLTEALDALGASADLARDARPVEGEPFPSPRFRAVAPALAGALRGARVPREDLDAAAARLADAPRGAAVYRAVLLQARGDAGAALTLAREASARAAPELAAALAWAEARAHAALDARREALDALARAVEGGLRGPLARDPAFVTLSSESRFANLATWARAQGDPATSWRGR
ncbi:MAG: protein kinase [Planctomycetes bacterium]|nr:protein kinase [Planctomycetota bacterium]